MTSGRSEQQALQRRIYGAADDAGIKTAWLDSLARIAKARVCVLAVPSDTGAGLVRGAAFGPAALRTALLSAAPDFSSRATRAGVVDVGDVFVVPQLLHDDMLSRSQIDATRDVLYPSVADDIRCGLPVSPLSMAERAAAEILTINPRIRFLLLGGDHSVTWPIVSALAASRSKPFAIVHVDAHTDLMADRLGVKYCFATWAYHANASIGRSGRLIQVGIRASGRPRSHWESTLGVRQFWASDVRERGEAAIVDDVLLHLRALGISDVFFSNDIDGTDAALAPATGAPEPDGLSESFVHTLIRRLGDEVALIGADLVEVAPPVGDPAGARKTVELGARYLLASLTALTGSVEFAI